MEHYIIVLSEDHFTYMKRHQEKNHFRTTTNMDNKKRTSIKTNMHAKTQVLIRLQSLSLVQK